LGGTARWAAPEVVTKREGALALSADIFSFGRLVFLIITAQKPLIGISGDDIISKIKAGSCHALEWPTENQLRSLAQPLVDQCTSFEPSTRPSIDQVQDVLRGWGSKADCAPLRAILSKAFPPCEERLGIAPRMKTIRSGVRTSMEAVVENGEAPRGNPPADELSGSLESEGGVEVDSLIIRDLEETPEKIRVFSLLKVMNSWNIPVRRGGCCALHTLALEVRSITDTIASTGCSGVRKDVLQCARCNSLCTADEADSRTACQTCGSSVWKERKEKSISEAFSTDYMLESIPENPKDEADSDDEGASRRHSELMAL